ncbi:MAG: hypothetical protein CYPHOPRED_002142 [Cyphobasidiales sp. Tagirdzhanova-0007]|nr:MAG: hypothetical protein CYPHOPRED_002142 [Cyphobasidiales sp. Tagirdzhanova-0007]
MSSTIRSSSSSGGKEAVPPSSGTQTDSSASSSTQVLASDDSSHTASRPDTPSASQASFATDRDANARLAPTNTNALAATSGNSDNDSSAIQAGKSAGPTSSIFSVSVQSSSATPRPRRSSDSASASSSSSHICNKSSDCPGATCIAGFCSSSNGFSISFLSASSITFLTSSSLASLSSTPSTTNVPLTTASAPPAQKGKKGSHSTATACSNAICTLSPDLVGMNTLSGSGADPGEAARALSSAAISGVVMAILFVFLAGLLVIPKMREAIRVCWRKRQKEEQFQVGEFEEESLSQHTWGNETTSPAAVVR